MILNLPLTLLEVIRLRFLHWNVNPLHVAEEKLILVNYCLEIAKI